MTDLEKKNMIKNLHYATGVGLALCKKALEHTNYNTEEAVQFIEDTTIAVLRRRLREGDIFDII